MNKCESEWITIVFKIIEMCVRKLYNKTIWRYLLSFSIFSNNFWVFRFLVMMRRKKKRNWASFDSNFNYITFNRSPWNSIVVQIVIISLGLKFSKFRMYQNRNSSSLSEHYCCLCWWLFVAVSLFVNFHNMNTYCWVECKFWDLYWHVYVKMPMIRGGATIKMGQRKWKSANYYYCTVET